MTRNERHGRSEGRRRTPWLVFAVVAAAVLAADQATKEVVRATVGLGEERDGIGPFTIHHVRNSGLLGGHLEGHALPIAAAATIALAGLCLYAARRLRTSAFEATALGLVLGGGLGNLVDRLRLGYVTDFIDRGSDGAFNGADVAIMVGLVAFGVAAVARRRTEPETASPAGEPPPTQ